MRSAYARLQYHKRPHSEGMRRRKKKTEGPVSVAAWPTGIKPQANDGWLRLFFSSLEPAFRVRAFYFSYLLFLCLETTSKITASKRTKPFTACCQLESTPINDMPLFKTPMKMAPTTAPPIVPDPP